MIVRRRTTVSDGGVVVADKCGCRDSRARTGHDRFGTRRNLAIVIAATIRATTTTTATIAIWIASCSCCHIGPRLCMVVRRFAF